ncbi:diguanylate cyclase (GGDEF)-like protein [Paenibacillus prosopidis]|uniref:Diguanylate cyclase (GGDEF)-like protein n=1 Tax=Paenibacillus prosopidis TaxID=630520 RepID=A0A368VQM0_9BACL|nr:diguanylate cyclase (GGDEF)-like protein [Paenibacillus prosopidis]
MMLHPEIIPALILVSILIGMFTMGYMLFRRWRSKMYLIFTASIAAALLVQLILLVSVLLDLQASSLGLMQSIVFPIAFMSLHGGFHHIFNPKNNKKLYIYAAAIAGSILTASLSFFVNIFFVEIALAAINVGFTVFLFYWALPRLAKRGKFLATFILNVCTAISTLLFSILELQILLFISITLCLATFSVLFVILFDRIIDLMQAVSYSSVTDGLTGLYQKHYFKRKVNDAIAAGDPCAVIFSDIDNFKRLNDTEGHQKGDVMLVFAATVMKEVCAGIGIVGRYGGEEIVALITDERRDPSIVAENYRARIEMESKKQGYVPITVSVGFSRLNEDIEDADEFIRQADDAMYVSKSSGKNRVTNYLALRNNHQDTNDNPTVAAAANPTQPNVPYHNADNQEVEKDKQSEFLPEPIIEQPIPEKEALYKAEEAEESHQSPEITTHTEIDPGVVSQLETAPELIDEFTVENQNSQVPGADTAKDANPRTVVSEFKRMDSGGVPDGVERKQLDPDDSEQNEIKQAVDPVSDPKTSTKSQKAKGSSSRTKARKVDGEAGVSASKKTSETLTTAPSPSNKNIIMTNDQSAPKIIRNPFSKKE